jgi:hypothetical protein
VTAAGVRPIASYEDELWERVAYYGRWLDRTGLVPDEVEDLPLWFRLRAPGYWAITDEVAQEKARGG